MLTTKILTSVSNILLKFSHSYFYCVYLHYPKNITLLIERKIYSWIRKIITPWQLSTVCVLSLSHVWLCDPMDYSLPGSSVQGILQTRILECVAISFSRYLPNPGLLQETAGEPRSPWQADSLALSQPPGKPHLSTN